MSDKTSEQNVVHAEGSETNDAQKNPKEVNKNPKTNAKETKDSGKNSRDFDRDVLSASAFDGTDADTKIEDDKFDAIYAEEERIERKSSKKKAILITSSIIVLLLAVYLGAAIFFKSHFMFGTQINGNDFSLKTAKAVEEYFSSQVEGYELNVETIEGTKEVIKGSDIDLVYKPGEEIKKALEKQNSFLWFTSFFSQSSNEVTVEVEYNKDKLSTLVAGLNCVTSENQIQSANAVPTFDGTQFVITPEVIGNQVHTENLTTAVNEAVTQFQTELNMEEKACYTFPQYTKDSPEVTAAMDSMNKYLAASITYSVGETPEVVDKTLISTWLSVDDSMNVVFNKDAVGAYLDEFCGKYNTVGTTRTITTPTGKTAQVSGGIYGWKIDRDKEYNTLIANIEAGEVITRDPIYSQTAASHGANDWGSTYIEVDLSTQQMWYIAEGSVAFQTAVVTGLPKNGRETPQGVNPILEKMRNKTLRGDKKPDGTYEYETPVDYWMRVTWTGIGFHDATWQPAFGGELYKTRGSHGCINMSHSDAATLYGLISVGMPVIIHY